MTRPINSCPGLQGFQPVSLDVGRRASAPAPMPAADIAAADVTYTLDGMVDGRYFSDYGLTGAQVAAATANAERLGVTILAVNEERAVDVADMAPFGVSPTAPHPPVASGGVPG